MQKKFVRSCVKYFSDWESVLRTSVTNYCKHFQVFKGHVTVCKIFSLYSARNMTVFLTVQYCAEILELPLLYVLLRKCEISTVICANSIQYIPVQSLYNSPY